MVNPDDLHLRFEELRAHLETVDSCYSVLGDDLNRELAALASSFSPIAGGPVPEQCVADVRMEYEILLRNVSSADERKLRSQMRAWILTHFLGFLFSRFLHTPQGEAYLWSEIDMHVQEIAGTPIDKLFFSISREETNVPSPFLHALWATYHLRQGGLLLNVSGLPAQAAASFRIAQDIQTIRGKCSRAEFDLLVQICDVIVRGTGSTDGISCLLAGDVFRGEFGRANASLDLFCRLRTVNGDDSELMDRRIGEFLVATGHYSEAIPILQKRTPYYGGHSHIPLARAYNGVGKHEEALASVDQFVSQQFLEEEFYLVCDLFFGCRELFGDPVPHFFEEVGAALSSADVSCQHEALRAVSITAPDDGDPSRCYTLASVRLQFVLQYLERHPDCPRYQGNRISLGVDSTIVLSEISCNDSKSLVFAGEAFRERAAACFHLNRLEEAEGFIQKSIQFLEHVGNVHMLSLSYRVAGDICAQRGFRDGAKRYYFLAWEYLEIAFSPLPEESQRVRLVDLVASNQVSLDTLELLKSLQLFLGLPEEVNSGVLATLECERDFYLFLSSPDLTPNSGEESVRDSICRVLKGSGATYVGVLAEGAFSDSGIPAHLHTGEGPLHNGPSSFSNAAMAHLLHVPEGEITVTNGPIILAHQLGLEGDLSRLSLAAFPICRRGVDHEGRPFGLFADVPLVFRDQAARVISDCFSALKQDGARAASGSTQKISEIVDNAGRASKTRGYLRLRFPLSDSVSENTVLFLLQQALMHPDSLVRLEVSNFLVEHKHVGCISSLLVSALDTKKIAGIELTPAILRRGVFLLREITVNEKTWTDDFMRIYERWSSLDMRLGLDTCLDRATISSLLRRQSLEFGIPEDELVVVELAASDGRLAYDFFLDRIEQRLERTLGNGALPLVTLSRRRRSSSDPEQVGIDSSIDDIMSSPFGKRVRVALEHFNFYASDFNPGFVDRLKELLHSHPLARLVLELKSNRGCIRQHDYRTEIPSLEGKAHIVVLAMRSEGHCPTTLDHMQLIDAEAKMLIAAAKGRSGGVLLTDHVEMKDQERKSTPLSQLFMYDLFSLYADAVRWIEGARIGESSCAPMIGPPGVHPRSSEELVFLRDAPLGAKGSHCDRLLGGLEAKRRLFQLAGLAEISFLEPWDLQSAFRNALLGSLESVQLHVNPEDLKLHIHEGARADTASFDRGALSPAAYGLSLLRSHGLVDRDTSDAPSGFWKHFLFPLVSLGVTEEAWQMYWSGFQLLRDEPGFSSDEIAQRAVFDFEGWVGDSAERADQIGEMKPRFREACSSAGAHRIVHRYVVQKVDETLLK